MQDKDERFTMVLPRELREPAELAAVETERSLGAWVRSLIKQELKREPVGR
jgi:predicted HicB family RNase H-like nuclease